ELVTATIDRVTTTGVVTADQHERTVDVIVHSTGFAATELLAPMEILGRDGQSLRDAWSAGAEAHLGISVAGFPNLFLLYGPNTNLGANSIISMIECQVTYVRQCLAMLDRAPGAALEVQPHVQRRFVEEIQRRMPQTAWQAGCA